MRSHVVAILCACVASGTGSADPPFLNFHYNSLCKECQMHVSAVNNIVWHGANETSVAATGILDAIHVRMDFYGAGVDCQAAENGTEHGPDMCTTDRINLCAQNVSGGVAVPSKWFDFIHCMFQNIDVLKCNQNGHCDTADSFNNAISMVFPMCAALTGVDKDAIWHCANGQLGQQLQIESYARTQATSRYGFAPVFLNDEHVQNLDSFWRKAPDQLMYGRALLSQICDAITSQPKPIGCP